MPVFYYYKTSSLIWYALISLPIWVKFYKTDWSVFFKSVSLFFNISFMSCQSYSFPAILLLLIGCYKVCKVLKYATQGFHMGEPGSGDNPS